MVQFVVRCCRNESYAGSMISFHAFPKDDTLKKRWLSAFGISSVSKSSRICHEHFKKDDFEFDSACRRKLKPNAVPYIFLNVDEFTSGIHILSEIQIVSPGPSCSYELKQKHFKTEDDQVKFDTLPDCSLSENQIVSPGPSYSSKRVSDKSETDVESKRKQNKTEEKDQAIFDKFSQRTQRSYAIQVKPSMVTKSTQTIVRKSHVQIQTNISKKESLLKRKIRRQKKEKMTLKEMLLTIKRKSKNYVDTENIIKTNFGDINQVKAKGLRYSDEVKKLALTIHFYSPRAYRALLSKMMFPHPSTLRQMLRVNNCGVGFINEVINYLKCAVEEDKDIQNVALVFDSMAIRSQITYDAHTGKHWGYVDLGGIATDDSEAVATEVLVFTIISLKKKFKCPIGYFFINKISAELQASLVKSAIILLNDINIIVRSITCDGTTTNIATYEQLGCKFQENELSTSFKLNDNEIFCILDPPHMLKLARNAFGETNLQSGEGNICFSYVQELNKIQNEENMAFANKITDVHINFAGKKMNVKLASQLLSSGVADAIEFLKASGVKEFENSGPTIEFIRVIDRIFDLMNAKNPFGKGFKSAMREANKNVWTSVLQETKSYLSSLQIDGIPILKHRRKTFALGFLINIESVSKLAETLLQELKFEYFLPYKCSQDHLEMLFSCIRSCGGNNNNPNAQQLRYTLRKLLYKNSVTPSVNANSFCEEFEISPVLEFRSQKKRITNEVEDDEPEVIEKLLILTENISHSGYQENILYYITGYIVKKIVDANSCTYCHDVLLHQKEFMDHLYSININCFSMFTSFVTRGKLYFASRAAFEVINFTDKCIKCFSEIHVNENIKKRIVNLVVQKFSQEISLFVPAHPISQSITCGEIHESQLIKYLSSKYIDIKLKFNAQRKTTKHLGNKSTTRQRLNKLILFSYV